MRVMIAFALFGAVAIESVPAIASDGCTWPDHLSPGPLISGPGGVTSLGDVTGDGLPDLVGGDGPDGPVVMRALGNGLFLPPESLGRPEMAGARLVDLTGDEMLDLVKVEPAGGNVEIRVSRFADGEFEQPTTQVISFVPGALQTEFADMDGDGATDLIIWSWESDGLVVMHNTGSGLLEAPVLIETCTPVTELILPDIDADGDADVLIRCGNWDGDVIVMRNDGLGDVVETMSLSGGTFRSPFASGDLNGDGLPEVVQHDGEFVLRVLVNAGDGLFSTYRVADGEFVEHVAMGDVDGDGWVDVLGDVSFFKGLGDGLLGERQVYRELGGAVWSVRDMDGDGDHDLVTNSIRVIENTCISTAGACCIGDGCLPLTSLACDTVGGLFLGIGASCDVGACPNACRSDLDDDLVVGFTDLLQLLTDFGPCDS